MTAAAILTILEGLVQAAPTVLALFQKANTGGTVTAAELQSALASYESARTSLVAAIAAQTPGV